MKCCEYSPSNFIFFIIKNELNKPNCYIQQGHKGLPGTTTPAYWAHSEVTKKMKGCEYSLKDCIHKTLLFIQHNELECYIMLGWKCFQCTNALAFLSHSEVTKKKKYCEYDPSNFIYFIIKNECNKLEFYIIFGWKFFQGTNAQAYFAHSEVLKKMKCCEYSPKDCFHKT